MPLTLACFLVWEAEKRHQKKQKPHKLYNIESQWQSYKSHPDGTVFTWLSAVEWGSEDWRCVPACAFKFTWQLKLWDHSNQLWAWPEFGLVHKSDSFLSFTKSRVKDWNELLRFVFRVRTDGIVLFSSHFCKWLGEEIDCVLFCSFHDLHEPSISSYSVYH